MTKEINMASLEAMIADTSKKLETLEALKREYPEANELREAFAILGLPFTNFYPSDDCCIRTSIADLWKLHAALIKSKRIKQAKVEPVPNIIIDEDDTSGIEKSLPTEPVAVPKIPRPKILRRDTPRSVLQEVIETDVDIKELEKLVKTAEQKGIVYVVLLQLKTYFLRNNIREKDQKAFMLDAGFRNKSDITRFMDTSKNHKKLAAYDIIKFANYMGLTPYELLHGYPADLTGTITSSDYMLTKMIDLGIYCLDNPNVVVLPEYRFFELTAGTFRGHFVFVLASVLDTTTKAKGHIYFMQRTPHAVVQLARKYGKKVNLDIVVKMAGAFQQPSITAIKTLMAMYPKLLPYPQKLQHFLGAAITLPPT